MGTATYKDWFRAARESAWRATTHQLDWSWPTFAHTAAALSLTFGLYRWLNAPSARENIVSGLVGALGAVIWFALVFLWNFALASPRMWRADRARITELETVVDRRIEHLVLAKELETCYWDGCTLSQQVELTLVGLKEWHDRSTAVISRISEGERAMWETFGPIPGLLVIQFSERENLKERLGKLRLIMQRQYEQAEK
jgi:hypothetical protein